MIYRVCCLAGSANLIDKIRADLDANHVRAAMRKRDTAAVFDWLIAALSYQGISDRIAYDYMEEHGYVRWEDINKKLAQGAACPKLKSYWHFHGCRYSKLSGTCAESDHVRGYPPARSCGSRMHSVRACAKAAMSKAGTSRSSTVGRTVNLRGFRSWQPNWCTVGSGYRRQQDAFHAARTLA